MWEPISLELINFISHIHTFYKYSDSLECIQGINLDIIELEKDKEESNGAGKSVLLEGEYVALLNSPIREDIVLSDLIFDKDENIKNAEVIFILQNKFLDLKLKIQRKFYLKGSSELFLYSCKYNEELPIGSNEEFSSVEEGNKRILELLQIQREDIINYYIISKDKYKSFYKTSDDKKKEIISRFSGGYLMEGIDKDIEKDKEAINQKLQLKIKEKDSFNSKIEVYKDLIEKEKQIDIEEEKRKRIVGINLKIEEINLKINNLIDKNKIEKKNKEEIKLKLDKKREEKIDDSKIIEIDNSIDFYLNLSKFIENLELEYKKKENLLKNELEEWEDILIQIDKNIQGSVICPKCKFEFNIKDETLNIEDLKNKKPDIEIEILEIIEEINKIKNKKINLNLKESNFIYERKQELKKEKFNIEKKKNDLKLELLNFENDIRKIDLNIDSNLQTIEIYNKQIKILEKEIIEIKEKKFETKIKEYKNNIKEYENDIEEIEKEIKKIEKDIEEKNNWVYFFNSFKSYLANKAIKNIEGQTNYFLQEMKSDIQIKLEGFTLLADKKTIREKISCDVIKNGNNSGKLGKCSKGEKARVELATILSLQKLLNNSSNSGGLNLLSIDEILESVSKIGMEKIITSLLNINNYVKLITHVNLDKSYDNISKFIIKENGISKLINNN